MNEKDTGQPAAAADHANPSIDVPQFCAQDRTELMVYVRQVLGFMPTQSLVLISVADQRLVSVLRVNLLPAEASSAELAEYLEHLIASCLPLQQARQLIAVVFADDSSTDAGALPPQAHIACVGQRYLPITHAYFVGPESIHTIFPAGEDPEPLSNSTLDSTQLCAHLTVEGFSSVSTAAEQVAKMVVPPWRKQHELRTKMAAIAARKDSQEKTHRFDVTHASHLFSRLEHWDSWIRLIAATGRGGRHDKNAAMIRQCPDQALELITDLDQVRTRDLVLVLASFPLMHTVAGAFQHFFSTEVQNEFFRGLAQEHTEEQVPDDVFAINFLSNALMASTELDPDWARTTALNALLRELLPLASRDNRQAILGLLAWSEWSMGRSSIAMVYLEKATAEDPGYRFTMLFTALLNTGKVAAWAARERF